MDQLEMVSLFMRTMSQPVLLTPTIPSPDRMALRMRLATEELKEFEDAVAAGDKTEMLDALIDRLYVLLGDFHECGCGPLLVEAFEEVQRSNMSKLGDDGKPVFDGNKVTKGPNYFKPNLKQFIV